MANQNNEVKNLRRDYLAANESIEMLQYELKRYQDHLTDAIAERNRYKAEIFEARDMILHIKQQVNDQVNKAVTAEKEKLREKLAMVEELTKELQSEKSQTRNLTELLNEKEALINKYKQHLRQLAQENPDNYELAEKIQDIENFREDRIINIKQLQKLAAQNQTLCNQMEDILAENRLLRNLAQVPENYGFNLEEIKLADRQKLEDYKAQVRYQEKEIEELEEERAKLRYRLRQLSTLFSNNPGERYKDLSVEQLHLLDDYAMNLKEGINEIPLNDRSRELQREIDKLSGQIQILENQNFGSIEAYLEKIKDKVPQRYQSAENVESNKRNEDEIKTYIIKLMETMGAQKDPNSMPQQQQPMSLFSMPPTPIPGPFGNWGDIREGFSYRFNSKMPVDTNGLYNEGGFDQVGAKYEIAFLQLHNLECLKLLHQKEVEYQSIVNETKELKEEIKRCLLVEDELFKTYFEEKKTYNEQMKETKRKLEDSNDRVEEMTAKLRVLEDSFNDIISKNPALIEAKLAHHTKRVALLDVNLIRLSRKYDCLSDEEKTLRDAYNKAETNNAEKIEYLNEKLFGLIEWKSKASKQLEILLEFEKNSFPADERTNLESKLDVMKNRYADIVLKEADYKKKLAIKESSERELFEKKEENRGLENEIVEIELEMEVLKKRLEQLDPYFKKYMSVFQQIVDVIKEQKISALAAFKMFDANDDGKISKNEFATALRNMKVMLSPEEVEILFLFIDLDGTGNIEYKEFLRRLRRSGVQIRRKEDELIFSIYKAITEVGLSLENAFEAFDRNGDNMISKKDMIDTFNSMGRTVDHESIDYIFKMADVSGDGLINYEEFYRLFETIVKDAKMENKRQTKMELDWKMEIMIKIDTVLRDQNLQLYDAFSMIDTDGNGKLTFDEFNKMFNEMKVPIPATELRNLFDCIDTSHNNEVSYNELLNYVRECRRESERIKRMKFLAERTEAIRNESALQAREAKESQLADLGPNNPATESNRFKMKITLLEIREKTSIQKIESLLHQLKNSEGIISELNTYVKDLEVSLLKSNEQYFAERERNIELQEKVNGGIPKKEADLLRLDNDRLVIENVSLKAANNTFRNLYQASMYQTSVLRISVEKSRMEVETFKRIIKELQGSGDRESMIGKLYYSLMISKWNEGEVNKKYAGIIEEFKRVTTELKIVEEKVDSKEDEIYETHAVYKEKILVSEKTISELKLKIIPTITITRIENLAHTVKEFSSMKTDLEILNKRLRDSNSELVLKLDALETQKSVVEDLEKRLKANFSDDMSQQLIEMGERMREYKLNELKSRREAASAVEKEEYYLRMNRQNLENLKKLEEDLAEWDIKFARREEFWHKRYNEQVKIVFSKGKAIGSDDQTLEKGFELFKRKSPTEMKEQRAEMIEKTSEINVLKKRLEDTEKRLDESMYRVKDLENQIMSSQTDHTQMVKIVGSVRNEETERMAMAAHKTIETLQSIIGDKDEENSRKDRYIEKLKHEFYLQKENDGNEIRELYEQLRINNQEIFQRQKSQMLGMNTSSYMGGNIKNAQILPEVNKLLNDKDEMISALQSKLEVESRGKKQANEAILRMTQEIDTLKAEIMIEQQKNAPEKFAKEIETLNKLIKHKDKEIKGFKESLTKLKEEFFKACDEKLESEKEYQALQSKLNSQGSNNTQMETKLKLATKKIEEINAKMRMMDGEIEERKVKEIEWKEKFSTMKQEKDRLQDLLDKATRDKNLRKPNLGGEKDKAEIEDKNISAFFKPKSEKAEEKSAKNRFLDDEDKKEERSGFGKKEGNKFLEKEEKAGFGKKEGNKFLEKEKEEKSGFEEKSSFLSKKEEKNKFLEEKESSDGKKDGSSFVEKEKKSELKEKIKHLEKQILILKQEKAKNLIDEDGFLSNGQGKSSFGFKDFNEVMNTMGDWFRSNPHIDFFKLLKENDKKRTGLLASEALYSELKMCGISLKPRDQALIDKKMKDQKGFVNYLDFYYTLKGMSSCEVLAKTDEKALMKRASTLKEKPLTSSEKKEVDVLKTNLLEMKKEKDLLEKQLANWKENAMNYQVQLRTLQNKFPKENIEEGIGSAGKNFASVQEYKDKIFRLEGKLTELEKKLTVDKEIELHKINEEKRKLENDLKMTKFENSKLRTQLDAYSTRKENEKLEEFDSGKEMIISNLKGKIDEARENEETLKKKLREAEAKIMELQFWKDNFDIQVERYQRRVTELEDVKSFYEEGVGKVGKPMKQNEPLRKEALRTLKKI